MTKQLVLAAILGTMPVTAQAAVFSYDLTSGSTHYHFTVDSTAVFDRASGFIGGPVASTDTLYGIPGATIEAFGATDASYSEPNQLFLYGAVPGDPLSNYAQGFALTSSLFQGPSSSPTLLAGTFLLTDGTGSVVVTADAGAVPEPATWAMMIAGFGLVGAGMRRRRTSVAFA